MLINLLINLLKSLNFPPNELCFYQQGFENPPNIQPPTPHSIKFQPD